MGGIFAIIIVGLGLLALVGSVFAPRQYTDSYERTISNPVRPGLRWAGAIALVVGLVVLGATAMTSVDEGEVHVPIQFGRALEPIVDPGIAIKSPFAGIVVMPTRTVELTFQGKAAAPVEEGSGEASLGQINALSAEGAQVSVDVTVLYHIDPTMTAQVYRTVGKSWEEVLVIPRVRNTTRDCLPHYTFEQARTSLRGEASLCILESMQSALGPRGIIIEDVLLRDMRADAQLQAAIDAKLEAQSNAQRAEFIQREAEVTAETKRIEAEGLANARIEEARGRAEAIRLEADAEAYANDVIALSLTDELLQLRIYEQLGNKTVVITDGTTAPLPILPLGE